MRRLTSLIFVSVLLVISPVFAPAPSQKNEPQPPKSEAKPALNAEKLAVEWMDHLNALDDWFISMDGKEHPEEVVNRMLELYAPDAIQFVAPSEDQIGTVMLRGTDAIRKWMDTFARSYVDLQYRINVQTGGKEQTINVIDSMPLPWGGLAVAFEIRAVYGRREDRRTFTTPGAVFLQFRDDGKIQRLRLFLQKDEATEFFP